MSACGSDHFDFFDVSDEDFARIDSEVASTLLEDEQIKQLRAWMHDTGEPTIEIVLENEQGASHSNTDQTHQLPLLPTESSPYARHRSRRGLLSVTDLTSLNWCELQFDYGLRQMRQRKLEHRPDTFVSASGKEIKVEKSVAARNDKILTRGKVVHKALEEEIRPEVIDISVVTEEERWGLRLVNMIACLNDLMSVHGEEGRMVCREMPVFGIVRGQPVTGIIDEIERRAPPHYISLETQHAVSPKKVTSSETSPKKARLEEHQEDLKRSHNDGPPPSPSKQEGPISQSNGKEKVLNTPGALPTTHTLHLFDSKTRRTLSLPPDEDTVSSQYQLMLYHRLLTSLMTNFDFATFWSMVGVNASRAFSQIFQLQVSFVLLDGNPDDKPLQCLNQLVELWERRLSELAVSSIDPTLTLVYRKQINAVPPRRQPDKGADISLQEQRDIEEAIRNSLQTIKTDHYSSPRPRPDTPQPPLPAPVEQADQLPLALVHHSESSEHPTNGPETIAPDGIIGRKEVIMDNARLDDCLDRALRYWYGHRVPEGVPLTLSRRCHTCEYREGCEWREEKADWTLRRYFSKKSERAVT